MKMKLYCIVQVDSCDGACTYEATHSTMPLERIRKPYKAR